MTSNSFAARLLLIPLMAANLSACSKDPASEPTAAATTEYVPDESLPSEPATPAATTPALVPAVVEPSIPQAAHGRWGMVPADCTSTMGDAKGLLEIDGRTLKFYESVGTLGAVKERSDTRIRAAFAFSGEGMTWTNNEVLDVQDGGKVLIRREYGDGALPGPLRYTRCE